MNHFLMVYADDPLKVNPCCKIFILKIGVKGWALLVVLPWHWACKNICKFEIYRYLTSDFY